MIGTTLNDIRDHIESLASDDGSYYLVCGRTGDRPVPADGLSFGSRTVAREAVRATEQYRAALREYDPQVPHHDVIICEYDDSDRQQTESPDEEWALSEPVVTTAAPEQRTLVEFCHRVAAAVFESLSDAGYGAVEDTIMDAYVELAETSQNPDELCLRLLESMARELSSQLTPAEQAEILARAAPRLPPVETAAEPVEATFAELKQCGLVSAYRHAPVSVDVTNEKRSVVVELSGYALAVQDGRLPVLPVVLDLYRRSLDWKPSGLHVDAAGDGWRLTIEFADATVSDELLCAPVSEV